MTPNSVKMIAAAILCSTGWVLGAILGVLVICAMLFSDGVAGPAGYCIGSAAGIALGGGVGFVAGAIGASIVGSFYPA